MCAGAGSGRSAAADIGIQSVKKGRIAKCALLLYKENHALDAWFNKAYGGKQEIPVSMIERSANCSTARNRDSASQG